MSGLCDHRWWNVGNVYRYRNDNLERMGFRSYRAYLNSALWKSIRRRVLGPRPLCEACAKRKATQVHHRSYDPATLKGENIDSLSAVCAGCHRKGERPFDRFQHASDRMARMGQAAVKHQKSAALKVKNNQIPTRAARPFRPPAKKKVPLYLQAPRKQEFPKAALTTLQAPRLVKT